MKKEDKGESGKSAKIVLLSCWEWGRNLYRPLVHMGRMIDKENFWMVSDLTERDLVFYLKPVKCKEKDKSTCR